MDTVKALSLDPDPLHNLPCQSSGDNAVGAQRPAASLRLPQPSCSFHLTAQHRCG